MMDILQEIIKADKAAAARVAEAQESRRKAEEDSSDEAKRELEELVAKERARAEEMCAEQEKRLAEKLAVADKERADRCKALDDIFDVHRAEWKAEIIARITGETS